MATPELPLNVDPDLLDDVIGGRRTVPAGDVIAALAATASLAARLAPAGPGIEARVAMVERFSRLVDQRRSPGLLGWLGLGYAGRRMARGLAAGALLFTAASGVTYAATGVSPGDVVVRIVDLGGNIVTNLNPGRDPGEDPAVAPEPTATPTSIATAGTTPPAVAPTLPPAPTPTVPPAGATQTFTALNAGTVTLSRTGATLEVVATAPNPGWSVEIDRPSGPDVEVTFTSGDVEVRFEAVVSGGQIVPNVEQREADGGSSGSGDDDGSNNSGPGGGEDDDSSGGGDD